MIYVQALGTPMAALIAAGLTAAFAYRQWRNAQNRLKLDLFDRRFLVYLSVRNLVGAVLARGYATFDDIFKFTVETRTAKWLFDNDIAAYIDAELCQRANDLLALHAEMERVPIGQGGMDNAGYQSQIRDWFKDQYDEVDRRFGPFLRISQ